MTHIRPTARPARPARLIAAGLSIGLAAAVLTATATPAQAAFTGTPNANPDLAASCGLDVVLALDASFSIDTGVEVRAAANAIIAPFANTSTRLGIVTFASDATTRLPLTLVTTDSIKPTGAHGAAVAGIRLAQGTNWEDALLHSRQVFSSASARPVSKLLVVVSDGKPAYYNLPDGSPSDPVAIGSAAAVDPAITQANLFKASGGHVLALGVEVGPGNTDQYDNLKAISEYPAGQYSPATAFNASTTDVALTPDFGAVGAQIASAVTQLCAGSLTVTERMSSAAAPTTYGNGGSGWAVGATVSPSGGFTRPSISSAATYNTTTDAGGSAVFQWDPSGLPKTSLSFTTGARTNYALGSVSCTRNGVAVGASVSGRTVTVAGGVPASAVVRCTVNNTWTGPLASIVTLTPSKKNVVYTNSTVTLRGSLRSPLAPLKGQKVNVQAKYPTASTWKTIRTFTTSSSGTFSIAVTPKRNTQYRATYAGKTSARAQYSGVSAVAPVNVGTAVYLKLSKSSVRKGAKVTFSGRVAPKKKAGSTVLLQRLAGSTWVTVKAGKIGKKSAYKIRYKTTSTVDYRWRVLKTADKKHVAGASGGVVLRVR